MLCVDSFLQLINFLFQTMKKVLEMDDPNELFDLVFLDFEMPGKLYHYSSLINLLMMVFCQ
jgi:hypothetical protein